MPQNILSQIDDMDDDTAISLAALAGAEYRVVYTHGGRRYRVKGSHWSGLWTLPEAARLYLKSINYAKTPDSN